VVPLNERVRLADLLAGLSLVSDLGLGLPPEDAMRSCLVGTALARKPDRPAPRWEKPEGGGAAQPGGEMGALARRWQRHGVELVEAYSNHACQLERLRSLLELPRGGD
jgi:hypothetical protein